MDTVLFLSEGCLSVHYFNVHEKHFFQEIYVIRIVYYYLSMNAVHDQKYIRTDGWTHTPITKNHPIYKKKQSI